MASTSQDSVQSAEARHGALQTRIISHMNADHADSLRLYLQHYCGVPQGATRSAKLTSISLENMVIESAAGRNLVHIDPPLKTFAEARERMVAMHQESLKALGLSDIKITEYAPPHRLWQWGLGFAALWCFVTFPFPEQIRPESSSFMAYGWSLGNRVPALAQLASDLAPIVLPGMFTIHVVESVYIWWSRLRKHGLSLSSTATWLWIGNTFISGIACIKRFDELVEGKTRAKGGRH